MASDYSVLVHTCVHMCVCGNNQREMAAFNFPGTIAHAWSAKVELCFELILPRIDRVYSRLAWDGSWFEGALCK